jgi:hypothetical protein
MKILISKEILAICIQGERQMGRKHSKPIRI